MFRCIFELPFHPTHSFKLYANYIFQNKLTRNKRGGNGEIDQKSFRVLLLFFLE